MCALSPITRPELCTSPSTRPSIWMSPVEVSVPFTTRSALMMDGAAERTARFGCGAAGAAGTAGGLASFSRLLLENMAACLDEFARIPHHIGEPHFVVDVRPCASARRSESSDGRTFRDFRTDTYEYSRKMTVPCAKSVAMVDFDHISITAARARPDHRSGCGRSDRCAPGTAKIQAGVKREMARERINASAEIAGDFELCAVDRRRQRHVVQRCKQGV